MSLITKEDRLTVQPFAGVGAVLDLPEIQRDPGSVSNVSSRTSMRGDIDLEEGCIVTKTVKYTHQVAHLVNAVRGGDPEPVENVIEADLKIIPYMHFSLDDPCNLVLLEQFVHRSLDLYAFIALSPSSTTVIALIEMVRSDNNRRQGEMDSMGRPSDRSLNFALPCFANPEYELVALHPEHFLPRGSLLTIYDVDTATHKHYVASGDQQLRETTEPNSACVPPFRHNSLDRNLFDDVDNFQNRNDRSDLPTR